jgi:hypothetical protein
MYYFGEPLSWSAADALGGTVGGYEFGMCLLESLQFLEQLIVITVYGPKSLGSLERSRGLRDVESRSLASRSQLQVTWRQPNVIPSFLSSSA